MSMKSREGGNGPERKEPQSLLEIAQKAARDFAGKEKLVIEIPAALGGGTLELTHGQVIKEVWRERDERGSVFSLAALKQTGERNMVITHGDAEDAIERLLSAAVSK